MSDQAITVLLQRVKAGEKQLLNDIYSRLYADIKIIAQFQINKLNTGQTITPTVLAHDCYLKIAKQNNINIENSSHFLNCLSISMRQLLIDVYRSKSSLKKQYFTATKDYNDITGSTDIDFKIIELDRLLDKVAKINIKYSEILNFKIILSMTFPEIAKITGQSERNVIRIWNQAKTLLTVLANDSHKNEF
jgi:RNA polymerase sigma factor (TIGR02999 family)